MRSAPPRTISDILYNFHWVVPGEAARAMQAWAGGLRNVQTISLSPLSDAETSLLVTALLDRDGPVILGTVLVTSTAIVLSNVLVDFLYVLLDPRVRQVTER